VARVSHPGVRLDDPPFGRGCGVLDERGRLYLAQAARDEILLQEVDPAAGRILRLARARPPKPVPLPDLFASPGLVWLENYDGLYAAFDTAELLPARWHDEPPVRDGSLSTHWMPDAHRLWVLFHTGDGDAVQPVDADAWKRTGSPRRVSGMSAAPAPEPLVCCAREAALELLAPDGAARRLLPAPEGGEREAHVHPVGDGWMVASLRCERDARAVVLRARGEDAQSPTLALPLRTSAVLAIATSREAGLCFVLDPCVDGPGRLAAVEPDGDSLRVRWTCEVPGRAALAPDRLAQRVALVWEGAQGAGTALLGAAPPAIPEADLRKGRYEALPVLELRYACGMPNFDLAESALRRCREEAEGRLPKLARLLREELAQNHPDELEWAARCFAVHEKTDLRAPLRLDREPPSRATLGLWVAHQCAVRGDWPEALRFAREAQRPDVGGAPLRDKAAIHAAHVEGLALAHLSLWDEARDVWSGTSDPLGSPGCRLHEALEWLDAVRAPAGTPGRGLAGRLAAAIVGYDAAQAAGDADAARRALGAEVLRHEEKQSAARFAEALLAQPPGEGAARIWHGHLLRRAMDVVEGFHTNLWLPLAWDDERLKALQRRIAEHLGRLDGEWDRRFMEELEREGDAAEAAGGGGG